MLTVQCPNCKHPQKTDPKDPAKASKRCVYCGKTFKLIVAGKNRIVSRD